MKGDRPRAHSRAVKKKNMKTKSNKKTKSGLQNRIAQSSTENTEAVAAPVQTPAPALVSLDYDKRREYRNLPKENLLSLLRAEAPRFFELAEIVGNWVWIQFEDKQPREV